MNIDISALGKTSWRPLQRETVEWSLKCTAPLAIVEGPTGCGKSLIGMAWSFSLDDKVVYLCSTRNLQSQLAEDFSHIGGVSLLWGRNNYPCLKDKELTAEDCDRQENECELMGDCPYLVAKRRALASRVAILNYSYFLHEANYVGGFADRAMVLDEFDLLETELLKFVKVEIVDKIRDKFDLGQASQVSKWESWKDWSLQAAAAVAKEAKKLRAKGISTNTQLRRVLNMEKIIKRLGFLSSNIDSNWVWERNETKWVFQPTWVRPYAKTSFWQLGTKFLGMSATILDPKTLCRNVDAPHYAYISLPSPFPKERRPIEYWPIADMGRRTENSDWNHLVEAMTEIMEKHNNEKGLVHCVSHNRAKRLENDLPSKRWLRTEPGMLAAAVEELKASKEPRILLSPSAERGLDLPDDDCRWTVLIKVPFPDLDNKQVKRRLYGSSDGEEWYAWETAKRIVQASGRGMRHPLDSNHAYILDKQFDRLATQWEHLFPTWFKESFV